jgi:hypothetical protein
MTATRLARRDAANWNGLRIHDHSPYSSHPESFCLLIGVTQRNTWPFHPLPSGVMKNPCLVHRAVRGLRHQSDCSEDVR